MVSAPSRTAALRLDLDVDGAGGVLMLGLKPDADGQDPAVVGRGHVAGVRPQRERDVPGEAAVPEFRLAAFGRAVAALGPDDDGTRLNRYCQVAGRVDARHHKPDHIAGPVSVLLDGDQL